MLREYRCPNCTLAWNYYIPDDELEQEHHDTLRCAREMDGCGGEIPMHYVPDTGGKPT